MSVRFKIQVLTLEGMQLIEERYESESDCTVQWEALTEDDDSVLATLPHRHLIAARYEMFRGEWIQTDRKVLVNDS